MSRQNWKFVEHQPEWIPAPLKVDSAGNKKPGFLCIHELENGNGLCGGSVFNLEDGSDTHTCTVMLRGRWNISRPCYDKYHRCPGWAGGGWKYAKNDLCHGDGKSYVEVNYEDKWWKWKTHRCSRCGVTVLPYMIRYTSPRAVWHRITRANLWWKIGRRFRRW